MSISLLAELRVFLLLNAVVAVLCATVWFTCVQRMILRLPGTATTMHGQVVSVWRIERFQRAWLLRWATACIFACWYFGTRSGVAAWTSVVAGSTQPQNGPIPTPDVRALSYRVRVVAAWAAVATSLLGFFAYAVYGVYLDVKLNSFAHERPPRQERWNAAYYVPGVEEWLRRSHRWERWNWVVWIGAVVLANLLYVVIHP